MTTLSNPHQQQQWNKNNKNKHTNSSYNNNHNKNVKRRRYPQKGNRAKKVVPESKPTCIVCNITTDRYKCPKCFMRYCSINCYRTHKESCTANTPENKEKSAILPKVINDTPSIPDIASISQFREKDEYKLTNEMKDNIKRHKGWIHDTFKTNLGLKQLIKDILETSSKNEEQQLEQLKKLQFVKSHNPNFSMFLDDLLLKAGILSSCNGDLVLNSAAKSNILRISKEELLHNKDDNSYTSSDESTSSSDDSSDASSSSDDDSTTSSESSDGGDDGH